MNKFILILCFFCIGRTVFAQEYMQTDYATPLNSISINFLGDASITSLNYSRIIPTHTDVFINTKFGIGYQKTFDICLWGGCDTPLKFISFPHHVTGNFGKKRSFLELGIGGTFLCRKDYLNYLLYPIIAYRLIPLKLYRVNFRVYAHYVFYSTNKERDIFLVPMGISVGLSF
ncbi:MAG: hypothetical protein U9N51_03895 [Bacteroidota bacterium]|nr:hypothetical protein [Bacteroidota bacterium]